MAARCWNRRRAKTSPVEAGQAGTRFDEAISGRSLTQRWRTEQRPADPLAPGGDVALVHSTGATDCPQGDYGAIEPLPGVPVAPAEPLSSEREPSDGSTSAATMPTISVLTLLKSRDSLAMISWHSLGAVCQTASSCRIQRQPQREALEFARLFLTSLERSWQVEMLSGECQSSLARGMV